MTDEERFQSLVIAASTIETILRTRKADIRWAIARGEERLPTLPNFAQPFYAMMIKKLKIMAFCADQLKELDP